MTDLVGAWRLVSCCNYRNDVARPTFGEPPLGQLQYTADGRMGAFLMDPAWAAKGDEAADSLTEFFSYGGRWERDGDLVRHFIEFASVPIKVGTMFERRLIDLGGGRIELVTAPETSKSGAVYVTRLVWERFG